jgi:hypothetical protein
LGVISSVHTALLGRIILRIKNLAKAIALKYYKTLMRRPALFKVLRENVIHKCVKCCIDAR